MNKFNISKKLTLLLSLFIILTATVHSTMGYVVTRTASVKNTFKPMVISADIVLNIPVKKTVENKGTATIGPEDFTFELLNVTTGEKETVKSHVNGNAEFTLGFNEADIGKTYVYTLSEVNDGKLNVTYSKEVYNISISVVLGTEGMPVAEVSVNGEVAENFVAEFTNIYNGDQPDDEPSPPTGDNSNLPVGIMLAVLSGAVFIAMTVYGRRRETFN